MRRNRKLLFAFHETLDSFGKETKHAVLYHLQERYGITLDSGDHNLPHMEQVEKALVDMFGTAGADALLRNMDKKVEIMQDGINS